MKTRYSEPKKKKVLVLGGYGFIGRHVVRRLDDLGHTVVIGTRNAAKRKRAVTIRFHEKEQQGNLANMLDGFDVVINTVGILRQRHKETYDQVHHRFVARLADACAAANVRLVHVSALGLQNTVRSRFLTSKRLGEAAITNSAADWFIVRPSIIDGEGGYGARWFRAMAKLPIHFAPSNALGTLRPIHVLDLAEAIAAIALNKALGPLNNKDREYDLGGAKEMKIFEYFEKLKGRPVRFRVRIPAWAARLTSHICDLLRLTPLSFGHYELLKFDNCPEQNRLEELIANVPRELGAKPRNYLDEGCFVPAIG